MRHRRRGHGGGRARAGAGEAFRSRAARRGLRPRFRAGGDSDSGRAQAALDKHAVSVPIYPDLKALFRNEQLDVLHVALPSSFHHDAASEAFERRINVICEKPLDITLERIDSMIAGASRAGVRLAGVYQNRFSPASRAIKAAIERDRFGPITWAGAFVLWSRESKYYQSWRGTKDIDGGGAIMNNSIHSIDLLQWLVGPIKTV